MTRCEARLEHHSLVHQCELELGHPGEHRHELRRCTLCWQTTPAPVRADELEPDRKVSA